VYDTTDPGYADRLRRREGARWKRIVDVQAPYRRNLRRLEPGFVLDVGCGLGRNLLHLDGHGVGIDHNVEAVAEARRRGLTAFTPAEFDDSPYAVPGRFDSLLLAHVVEHMRFAEAVELLGRHLPFVRAAGKVILITPQEAGYRSDPTHVEFAPFERLAALLGHHDVRLEQSRSFPFPRPLGRVFRHNEFVVMGRIP
jgi:SAM-dependent methyltransferase